MFLGFLNTFTNFQNYINKLLVKMFNVFTIIYLENFLIYIKNTYKSNLEALY